MNVPQYGVTPVRVHRMERAPEDPWRSHYLPKTHVCVIFNDGQNFLAQCCFVCFTVMVTEACQCSSISSSIPQMLALRYRSSCRASSITMRHRSSMWLSSLPKSSKLNARGKQFPSAVTHTGKCLSGATPGIKLLATSSTTTGCSPVWRLLVGRANWLAVGVRRSAVILSCVNDTHANNWAWMLLKASSRSRGGGGGSAWPTSSEEVLQHQ